MKASTVIEKVEMQRQEGEKGQILRELSALLVTTPNSHKRARSYITKAMNYIRQN